jgi:hypothetical protein
MQSDVSNILQWEFVAAIYVCRLFRKQPGRLYAPRQLSLPREIPIYSTAIVGILTIRAGG